MAYQRKALAEGSLMKLTITKTLFGGGKTLFEGGNTLFGRGKTLNGGEFGKWIFKKLNYKTLEWIRISFK